MHLHPPNIRPQIPGRLKSRLLDDFTQMHEVGVPASESQLDLHSHHSSDSVAEMVATAASATVLIVVGVIGTGGRPEHANCSN